MTLLKFFAALSVAVTCIVAAPSKSEAAGRLAECDWIAGADMIMEPWAENTRTFANGSIRIALIDTGEPAAAAIHLLMLVPDEEVGRACHLLSAEAGGGFGWLEFSDIAADYNPSTGLLLSIPTYTVDFETGEPDWPNVFYVHVLINTGTGAIQVENHL